MEKSAVSDRLREFVKSLGLSNMAFEKECGLYNGYVKDIGTRVEVEKLGAILLKFPQLNLNWLLAGQGKMTNESIGTTAQSPYAPPQKAVDIVLWPFSYPKGERFGEKAKAGR